MAKSVHLSELPGLVGEQLGTSEPLTVTQEMIDLFAEATGDHQWIHVDRERAEQGPFGTTIAHGYLTLSLLPQLTPQLLQVDGVGMAVNYGLNKLRFPSPVPSGTTVRAEGTVKSVDEASGGATQVTLEVTVSAEGESKPACVAESLTRYYPAG